MDNLVRPMNSPLVSQLATHQKSVYIIDPVSRSLHLPDHSPSSQLPVHQPLVRKRRHIQIEPETNDSGIESVRQPLKRLKRGSEIDSEYENMPELVSKIQTNEKRRQSELDHRGNLRDLIDYSYDSDSDSNYSNEDHVDPNGHDQIYQSYLQTLNRSEQAKLKQLELELNQYNQSNNQPLKYRILMSSASIQVKSLALSKLVKLNQLDKSSSDYAYELNTLNYLLDLPWNKYIDLPISKTNEMTSIQHYLAESSRFLETVTYGQHKAKSTLLLKLARYLENPESSGFILGIKGPPGCGKTTLMNNGLAKLLNRPFFRVDLGGAKHSDSLLGTRKVFERSDLGDLTRFLIEGKCMNPVVFFDELDKVSLTEYGTEIINTLNDLTDKTRNNAIVDQHLGVALDFSKVIFVFAYNSSELVPLSLRSRIHEIEIEPYTVTDKIAMCNQFFLPKACRNLNFDSTQIQFEPTALKWLITQQDPPEEGARELERSLENIVEKISWGRLTLGHEINDYHCGGLSQIQFPVKVTPKLIKQLF